MATSFNFRQWPLLPFLLLYIVGILCYDNQLLLGSFLNSWWIVAVILLATGLILLKIFSSYRLRHFAIIIFGFATILLGFGRSAQVDVRNEANWFGQVADTADYLLVTITEAPREKARTLLLQSEVNDAHIDNSWQRTKGKLLVYVYKNENLPQFRTGSQWIIPAQLVPITHNNNPGSFDFAAKQKREGYYFQTFLDAEKMQLYRNASGMDRLERLRSLLLFQLETYIIDPKTRALTQATLLNEAEQLDPQMQQDYANTGISHIIAISGMHVNLLFGLLVTPMFWIRDKRKVWIKYMVVLPVVWIYVSLCHFPPSAVRAAVGFTLITIALFIKRPQNNIHLLQINAFVLLLYYPMWLFHIGVQLSFLAVLSILIFYPKLKALVATSFKLINIVGDVVALSIAVQILVFPLVIYYFHQFPIWFLVANLLAALFSIIQMGTAFMIMIFGVVGSRILASLLGKFLCSITTFFNQIITWLNQHTYDFGKALSMDSLDFVLIMGAIVFLSVFWFQKKLWSLFAGLVVLLGFVLNLILLRITLSKQERIIVFANTRQSAIAKIDGTKAYIVCDALTDNLKRFVLEPSLLYFRLSQTKIDSSQNKYWELGKKRIAYLREPTTIPNTTLDVLILSKEAQMQALQIRAFFGNPLVVLDGSFGRNSSLRYENALSQEGIFVHNTIRQGAWWYYSEK